MKLSELHIKDPDTTCDFCSAPLGDNHKLYIAGMRSVIPLEDAILKDDGEWLACQVCAELKDNNKWDELLVRCTDSIMQLNHIPEAEREQTSEQVYAIWQMAFGLPDKGEN